MNCSLLAINSSNSFVFISSKLHLKGEISNRNIKTNELKSVLNSNSSIQEKTRQIEKIIQKKWRIEDFEDDVSFDHTKLLSTIEQLIQNHKLWDIVSFNLEHRGTPLSIKNLSNNQRLVVYLTEVTFSGAYLINREAAAKLLKNALPIKMPIDYYFTRTWKLNLRFTGIEPRLVHQTFGTSDIYYTKKPINNNKNIFPKMNRAIYKLQSYTMRFLYNLKIYIKNRWLK